MEISRRPQTPQGRPRMPPPPSPSIKSTTVSASPAVRQNEAQRPKVQPPKQTQASQGQTQTDEVLLEHTWGVHFVSQLYRFHREQLGNYAHDLVKFLRAAAVQATRGQEYGYSVSVRTTNQFIVFQIQEDRRGDGTKTKSGFVLHQQAIDGASSSQLQRRSSASSMSSSSNGTQNARKRSASRQREHQYVVLLRGSNQVLAWTCSWLQQRFQCIVGRTPARFGKQHVRKLAAECIIDVVSAQAKSKKPNDVDIDDKGVKAPLLLKFRNNAASATLRTYTLTVPWNTVIRLYKKQLKSSKLLAPDIVTHIESEYFPSLPMDLSQFHLSSFELQEVAADDIGHLELYKMQIVPHMLNHLTSIGSLLQQDQVAKPQLTL